MNPLGLTISPSDGTVLRFSRPEELYLVMRSMASRVHQSNIENARVYFALGEVIVLAHEQLSKDAMQVAGSKRPTRKHLIKLAGVHHQTGKRAVRWYNTLKDPVSGAFSMELYLHGAHEVAERVAAGTMRARVDDDGYPSVTAMEQALGHRSLGKVKEPQVPLLDRDEEADDGSSLSPHEAMLRHLPPISELEDWDGDDWDDWDDADHADHAASSPGISQAGGDSTLRPIAPDRAGAAGPQLMIDFDLLARERRVHEGVSLAVRMLAEGTLDMAIAAGIDERLRRVTDYIDSTIDRTHDSSIGVGA